MAVFSGAVEIFFSAKMPRSPEKIGPYAYARNLTIACNIFGACPAAGSVGAAIEGN